MTTGGVSTGNGGVGPRGRAEPGARARLENNKENKRKQEEETKKQEGRLLTGELKGGHHLQRHLHAKLCYLPLHGARTQVRRKWQRK